MAFQNKRTSLIFLAVLVSAGGSHGRLILTTDLKADTHFCGHLKCWNAGTSDKGIFAFTSISLYDIRQPEVRIQLATVKSDGTGVKINQSKTSEVVGAGCINRFDADLSVNLMNQEDCQSGSFLCELEYIDTDGHSHTLIAHSKSANSGGQCECDDLTSQQSMLARQLNTLRQNYTLELAFLRENYTTEIEFLRQNYTLEMEVLRQYFTLEMEVLRQYFTLEMEVLRQNYSIDIGELRQENLRLMTQFQNISEVPERNKNLTSELVDQTSLTSAAGGDNTFQTELDSTFNCTKGMAHNSSRVKFLLWDEIPALCDTETDGGGWVIIQRRTKGDVDFYKDWQSYKTGFGTPDTDFWLGNDIIHNLTSQGYNEARIDMADKNKQYYAHYDVFNVDSEQNNYRLTVSGYKGNAADSLYYHNVEYFSTFDRDNDAHPASCAVKYHGAWWYHNCHYSNLNGAWAVNNDTGVVWHTPDWERIVLNFTEIKVRRTF